MFNWIKKHPKLTLIFADTLLLPGFFLCRWLTGQMLSTDRPCAMAAIGGQCITCGGTHFVSDLTHFRLLEALQDNPFLFALTVFLLLSLIFLHLWILFSLPVFKKLLKRMYSIPSLILWLSGMLVFLIIRNIPLFLRILELIV